MQPLPTCPYGSLCKTAAGAPRYFCVRCADANGACVHTDLVRVYGTSWLGSNGGQSWHTNQQD